MTDLRIFAIPGLGRNRSESDDTVLRHKSFEYIAPSYVLIIDV